MEYTLITKSGKVMQFYVESLANTYQRAYGGVVISQQILNTASNMQKVIDL